MVISPTEFKTILQQFEILVKRTELKRLPHSKWVEITENCLSTTKYVEINKPSSTNKEITVSFIGEACSQVVFIGYIDDDSFGSFLYAQKFGELTDKNDVQKLWAKKENTFTSKKENNKMFGKIEFGSCENDNVRLSPYGLAVQNNCGTWVAYDKASEDIIDVDIFSFDGGKYLYKMPVAINTIAIGDIIIHNRVPMVVTKVDKDNSRLICVDTRAGEEKVVIPTKNMFNFNYITKVVNLFDNLMGTPTADQPFGNMLPFMLADSNSEMLPLAFMMTQGGKPADFNPMLLYCLMKDNSSAKDLLPFLLMSTPSADK